METTISLEFGKEFFVSADNAMFKYAGVEESKVGLSHHFIKRISDPESMQSLYILVSDLRINEEGMITDSSEMYRSAFYYPEDLPFFPCAEGFQKLSLFEKLCNCLKEGSN